ncbi:unnamed protein product [Nesidiocoris tenuis]|uniref:Uncharacterized protein n=1 Tax=Nesidiocoris tenuis TaxID=355587 RepID=A0A6H5GXF0_9HEMI|nr:unnamed protein product [Nesidiocoris tenuis]
MNSPDARNDCFSIIAQWFNHPFTSLRTAKGKPPVGTDFSSTPVWNGPLWLSTPQLKNSWKWVLPGYLFLHPQGIPGTPQYTGHGLIRATECDNSPIYFLRKERMDRSSRSPSTGAVRFCPTGQFTNRSHKSGQ